MTRTSAPLYLLLCVLITFSANVLSNPTENESDTGDLFQLSIEQLIDINVSVITPSKLEEPLSQSPGIVSVFTDKEIALFGARDLGEVLSRITGIQPYNTRSLGRYRLAVRGDKPAFNNNHVLILLNGTPFNRESFAGGLWTQASVVNMPIPLIKRIEVSRGPGSVLYGTNAFSGVVNIITKGADELENEVTVSYGTDDTRAVDVSYATTKGDLEVAAAGRYFKTDGWDYVTTTSTGNRFSEPAFSDSPSFMLTAKFKDFYATSSYGTAEQFAIRGNETLHLTGNIQNTNFFLDLGFDHTFANDWQLKTSASYSALRTRDIDNLLDIGILFPVDYQSDDARLELTTQGPVNDKVNLLVGGTIDYFSGNVSPPSIVARTTPDWEDYLYGLYGQVEYQLAKTKFVAGAQYNKPEGATGKLVPRLAVIHNFTDSFGVKALYGQAFRAPYAFEKNSAIPSGSVTFLGNSSLEHELVTNYDLQFFYEKDQFQASVTLFKSEQEDLITRVSTSPTTIEFQNKNSLDIKGFEIESKFTFKDNWYFTGSFSYQTNEDGDGVKNFTLQPSRIVKLGLGYITKNWSIGIFDSYFDQYLDNSILNDTASAQKFNPKSNPYHNLSIKASMTLPDFYGIKLNAYADNLLDEDVYLPVQQVIPGFRHNTSPGQAGRFFMVGITVPF